MQAAERLRPTLQGAGGRIRHRPERVVARQRKVKVAALRGELLDARMRRFRAKQRWDRTMVNAGVQQDFDKEAQAEQARQGQNITILDEAELRIAARHERMVQQRRAKREQEATAHMRGQSPGM